MQTEHFVQKINTLFQNKTNGRSLWGLCGMGTGLITVLMCVFSYLPPQGRIQTKGSQKRSVGKLVVGVRG